MKECEPLRPLSLIVLSLIGPIATPGGVWAQDDSPPQTYARRGLVIGGLAGGISGGLALGVLADGLCESDCDHALRDGMVLGFLGGGALGGLTGLIIGAAIPREGEREGGAPAGPWGLRLAGGPRWAGPSEIEGLGFWLGLSALRRSTSRVSWGLEMAYLGGGEEEGFFSNTGRDGEITSVATRWRRHLWNLSFVATRSLGPDPSVGPYVLADAGIYPLSESVRSLRTSSTGEPVFPTEVSERSLDPLPGFGIGGGGLWRVGPGGGIGVESRFRLILGAGNEAVLPLYSLGLSYLF